jgi:hypothetical protein
MGTMIGDVAGADREEISPASASVPELYRFPAIDPASFVRRATGVLNA